MRNKTKQKVIYPLILLAIFTTVGLFNIFNTDKASEKPVSLSQDNETLRVSFLDVGQGMATLLSHDSDYVLIDTGDTHARENLLTDLNNAGVKELEYVIISHPHSDHMANLDEVVENYTVNHVLINDMYYDSQMWSNAQNLLEEKEIDQIHPMAEDRFKLGDVVFTVLNPTQDPNHYDEANDSSIVVKVSHGEDDFLFGGDATVYVENELLHRYKKDLDIEVYDVSHHGSYLSSSPQFLQALSPEIHVISAGENNQYGHPHEEVLDRIAKVGGTIYRTDQDGTVVMESQGNGIKVIEPN